MNNQDNYTYEEVLELTKQGVEIWRRIIIDDIVFDYEVSNLGRIKSLKWNGNGKRIGYGGLNKSGYMKKDLCYVDKNGNKKYKSCLVHRLVATMFIPNSDNKPFVDHISTDRTNNKVDNLRWVTRKENINNPNTKKNMSEAKKGKSLKNLTDEEKYPCVTNEDISTEEWKPIKGYEGCYEISDMGRVKSLGFGKSSKSKKRLLQPYVSNFGYQIISLMDKNSKCKKYSIHQLVAKHFIPNPDNYNIVDHINTNRVDNRYFNLRWVTQKENMNNDKTKERTIRPVIVLDRNGNVISNGLGVEETAKNIGIGKTLLKYLLKSNKPYRANTNIKTGNPDLLRSLNGMRAYYICTYNEEEVLRKIAEDKTDYSYCINDLVCVYPEGKISKPMNGYNLAKKLGVGDDFVYKLRDSKKSYKAPSNHSGTISKEYLKHLQTLEGIRIMYYEDYLKERND